MWVCWIEERKDNCKIRRIFVHILMSLKVLRCARPKDYRDTPANILSGLPVMMKWPTGFPIANWQNWLHKFENFFPNRGNIRGVFSLKLVLVWLFLVDQPEAIAHLKKHDIIVSNGKRQAVHTYFKGDEKQHILWISSCLIQLIVLG